MKMMLCLAVFAMSIQVSTAVDPVALSQDDIDLFLRLHNYARSEVGVDGLVWNKELADGAAKHVSSCQYGHSSGNYGENIAASYPRSDDTAGAIEQATGMWVGEKKNYEELGNWSCMDILGEKSCGHYSQVVWANTKEVGCGIAHCTNKEILENYIVCRYSPSGNYQGQTPY